ncbi:MAG TPA: CYTH domain-containing protein [Micromonosporaceae bacterium]
MPRSDTEFEGRVLDVDFDAIRTAIEAAGGELVGAFRQRRYVYDVPGARGRWIRLRSDGTACSLAVKEIVADAVDGTKEVEVAVEDFDRCADLLERMGFTAKAYQENHRTRFALGDVTLDLDQWPGIPLYLEIEGPDADSVHAVLARLGLPTAALTFANVVDIYAAHGVDIDRIPRLTLE